MAKMSVDNKLGLTKFKVYEAESHIDVDTNSTNEYEIRKLLLGCPAHLYTLDENGKLQFNHEGCLECGTCRILSGGKVVKGWDHPINGFGVEFRQS